jgi:hypothetical protein
MHFLLVILSDPVFRDSELDRRGSELDRERKHSIVRSTFVKRVPDVSPSPSTVPHLHLSSSTVPPLQLSLIFVPPSTVSLSTVPHLCPSF